MNTEETIKSILKDSSIFTVKFVSGINHKPHPYTIGPRHINWANEGSYGGMLGKACIIDGENLNRCSCAHPHCNIPYEKHTCDIACFLQLKRNASNKDAQEELKKVVNIIPNSELDGFVFVDTEGKFRIN